MQYLFSAFTIWQLIEGMIVDAIAHAFVGATDAEAVRLV